MENLAKVVVDREAAPVLAAETATTAPFCCSVSGIIIDFERWFCLLILICASISFDYFVNLRR